MSTQQVRTVMDTLFFDSWENLLRVLISAPILYFAVILFVRISGKRSTSQMNNFDWIVTVAMGSLVGSGIILKDVTLSEVCAAIAVLLLLQYAVTRSIVASQRIAGLVKAAPTLLVYKGEFQHQAMRSERVTDKEIYAAMRESGVHALEDVAAITLETDANLSVLPRGDTETTPSSIHSGE